MQLLGVKLSPLPIYIVTEFMAKVCSSIRENSFIVGTNYWEPGAGHVTVVDQ